MAPPFDSEVADSHPDVVVELGLHGLVVRLEPQVHDGDIREVGEETVRSVSISVVGQSLQNPQK